MRIRRIRLQDYRRYRDAEVELPDGVTAILGRNGSGKSSLLEAVSFALFGPGALRTDKHLLRREGAAPADPVRVELDLELGGQAVRVVRELRGRTLAPSASLEVDGIVLVAPGAGSSEAATAEVERRLGMERDAFHTTVMAQQGELSRLSDARPADRKRLLLRMLGIDRVEAAVEEARSRRGATSLALERLRASLPDLASLEQQVRERGAEAERVRGEAVAMQADSEAAETAAVQAAAALAREEQAAAVAQEQRARLADLQAQEARLQADVARLSAEAGQADEAGRRALALAPVADDVERRDEELRAATIAEAARAQHAERLRAVQRQREAIARLSVEATALAPAPVEAGASQRARQTLAMVEGSLGERARELAVLEERAAVLGRRSADLGRLGPMAPCPMCERPLDSTFSHLHTRTLESQAELDAHRRQMEEEVQRLRRQADEARRGVDLVQRQESEAQRIEARRSELSRRLAEEAARMRDLEATLGPAPPPGADLAVLRTRVLEARRAREDRVRLETVAARAPTLAAALLAIQETLASTRAARLGLEAGLVAFDPARLQAARSARDAAAARARTTARRLQDLLTAAQRITAEAAVLQERLDNGRRTAVEAAALEREAQVWAAVVGRNGGGLLDRFRDHLVGRVGPAISAEAGRLLSRFTAGRYTEVVLDDEHQVFVADNGVPYQLGRFSGGEADLVHLALRLAVSRLLADRGGTELRFLALDEVFGSLDHDRKGLVVAALQELGTLYSQVLVVSHLEGLQESLGQVLRVGEGPDGEATLTLEG